MTNTGPETHEELAALTGHTVACAANVWAAHDENLSLDFPAPYAMTYEQRDEFSAELLRRVRVALEDRELCSCDDPA